MIITNRFIIKVEYHANVYDYFNYNDLATRVGYVCGTQSSQVMCDSSFRPTAGIVLYSEKIAKIVARKLRNNWKQYVDLMMSSDFHAKGQSIPLNFDPNPFIPFITIRPATIDII